jgi:aerobic-type carbon monoxide dehydrogenase small subunit (CoxS/CutS family)
MRIDAANVERGESMAFSVDGISCSAYTGETIVAALLNSGHMHQPNLFCNMGVCGDCTVQVTWPGGTVQRVRACLTPVIAGIQVRRIGSL